MKKLLYFLVALAIAFIVWRSPHWHSLSIHDVRAFRVVLLLGVFQTIVAIYGGYLAVLALPVEVRAWHSFRFAALGVALFGLTFYVGVLNDGVQYALQTSLDNSTAGLTTVSAALPNLKLCDLSGIDKIQTYIAGVIRSTSNRSASPPPPLVVPPVPVKIVTPPATDPITSLSQLSNTDLRDRAKAFASDLQSEAHRIYIAIDESDELQNDIHIRTENNVPITPEFAEQAALKKQLLDGLRNGVRQKDVPLAMAYRQVLLKRLGSQAQVTEFPLDSTDRSPDLFLIRSSYWLDKWADQLGPTDRASLIRYGRGVAAGQQGRWPIQT